MYRVSPIYTSWFYIYLHIYSLFVCGDPNIKQYTLIFCKYVHICVHVNIYNSDPTAQPSVSPTISTPAPTIDGCDFSLTEYLEYCYCDAVTPPGSAAKIFETNNKDTNTDNNINKHVNIIKMDEYKYYFNIIIGLLVILIALLIANLVITVQTMKYKNTNIKPYSRVMSTDTEPETTSGFNN